MPIYKADINWWVREAQGDANTASEIITALGDRVRVLQEQNELLVAENIALKRAGGEQGLKELQMLKETIITLSDWLKEEGLNRHTIACITSNGKGVQIPYPSVSALKDYRFKLALTDESHHSHVFSTYRHEPLIILSSSFQVFQIYSFAIPYVDSEHSSSSLSLPSKELAVGEIAVVVEEQSLQGAFFAILVTRKGFVQKHLRKSFQNLINTNHAITEDLEHDSPAQLVLSSGKSLLLTTRNGRWSRFSPKSIPADGAYGLELGMDDQIVGAVEIDDHSRVFFVGADGSVVAMQGTAFANMGKIGGEGGRLPIGTNPIACFSGGQNPHIIWLSRHGTIGITNLEAVPIAAKMKDAKRVNLIQQEILACSAFFPHSGTRLA